MHPSKEILRGMAIKYNLNKRVVKKHSLRRWKEENPEKVRAHRIVFNEKRYKRIKQLPCKICGSEKSEAHHPNYAEPLKVIWLCHRHHMQLHVQAK